MKRTSILALALASLAAGCGERAPRLPAAGGGGSGGPSEPEEPKNPEEPEEPEEPTEPEVPGQTDEVAAIQIEIGGDHFCGVNPCGTIGAGVEFLLVARIVDVEGELREDLPVTWSSSDPEVATVDENGLVRGIDGGTAHIVAEAGSNRVQGAYEVTVLPRQVVSIEIVQRNVELQAGETVQLDAIARDEQGRPIEDVLVEWSAGNPHILRVDQSGRVTGLMGGTAAVVIEYNFFLRGWALVEVSGGPAQPPAFGLDRIAAGGASSCGLTPDGKAWCWGHNASGELGVGRLDSPLLSFPTPEAVQTDLTFESIHVGSDRACGILADDTAWCWGSNQMGMLGVARESDDIGGTTVPAPLLGGTIAALSLGGGHTCAIATEGETYCWGMGDFGALGHGGNHSRWLPELVAGEHAFTRIAAGSMHTCALDELGKAWCWGSNEFGQIGNGAQRDGENLGELLIPVLEPTAVAGDHTFVTIDAETHTCALTGEGEAWCWGINHDGQIADPAEGREFTSPRQVATDLRFVDLQVGAHHSCGRTAGGEVWCWGNNYNGQLGDGTMDDSHVPVQVRTDLRFESISIGVNFGCGVPATGGVYCWGSNYFGEGGGGFAPGYSPVPWQVIEPLPAAE